MTMMTAIPYDDIVFACTNLCQLLEIENEAIERHDARTVRELAENKAALARLYEQSVMPMADDPQLVETLEDDQKVELKTLGAKLKELVELNARLLRAEIEATQSLMDAMVGAVKSTANNGHTYGRGGTFDMSARGAENSLTFNKTL